jgi:hypothetical protein
VNRDVVVLLAAGASVYAFYKGDRAAAAKCAAIVGLDMNVSYREVPAADWVLQIKPELQARSVDVVDCREDAADGPVGLQH